jgi:hypothetical protein
MNYKTNLHIVFSSKIPDKGGENVCALVTICRKRTPIALVDEKVRGDKGCFMLCFVSECVSHSSLCRTLAVSCCEFVSELTRDDMSFGSRPSRVTPLLIKVSLTLLTQTI